MRSVSFELNITPVVIARFALPFILISTLINGSDNGFKITSATTDVASSCPSSKNTLHLYLGDSRTRNLFGAHLSLLGLDPGASESYYEDARCTNNTFRYSNSDYCLGKATLIHTSCGNSIAVLECWRSDLECFSELYEDPSRAGSLIRGVLKRSHSGKVSSRIFERVILRFNIGLHDMVYSIITPDEYVQRMVRIMDNIASVENPILNVTWIDLYHLIPPTEDTQPKFSNWAAINQNIDVVAPVVAASAKSFGFDVLNVSVLLGKSIPPHWSYDTEHLNSNIEQFLLHEMLHLSKERDFAAAMTSLTSRPAPDLTCGARSLNLPGEGEHVLVAFLGGSVTSDYKYISSFVHSAKLFFNWTVEAVNLGEPATGSAYQSMCWRQTSGGKLSSSNIIILEYCANDFDNGNSIRRLLKSILESAHHQIVLYYCHLGPRSRFDSGVMESHMDVAREKGIMALTNKHILKNVLKREEHLFFRDDIHLTEVGGHHTGYLLLQTLKHCSEVRRSDPRLYLSDDTASNTDKASPIPQTTCHTSLGPEENRNLDEIVTANATEGWHFVQDEHPSAPNGKNGYETNVSGSCLSLSLNATCDSIVMLFYRFSSDVSMGNAVVTLEACQEISTELNGYWENGYTITAQAEIHVPPSCCFDGPRALKICSLQRYTNSSKFRVMAVGVEVQ